MSDIGSSAFLGTDTAPAGTDMPSTAEQAIEKIADLKQDAGFVKKYLAGDADAKKRMAGLHEIAARPGGIVSGDLPRNESRAVDSLAEFADLSEEVQNQMRSGQPVSETEFKRAINRREQMMRDSAWRERYLAGGQRERQEMALVSIILASRLSIERKG